MSFDHRQFGEGFDVDTPEPIERLQDKSLIEKPISRVWHEGRQKFIYVLKRIKHMSPL